MNCTLCDALLTDQINDQFFDCKVCHAIVKNDAYYLTASEEKKRYELHNNEVTDLNYQKFTSPITEYVLQNYQQHHKGLDFGSGTGPVISHVLQSNKYQIVQYDHFFAPNTTLLTNTYDYIVCCEVFEHFYHPKIEIENLIRMLKSKSTLLIMTLLYADDMDFNSWFYKNDPTHVFIYRKETFVYIAKKYNLEIKVSTDRLIALEKK